MSDSIKILESWEDLKELVASLELDVHKNAIGVKSAGVRARRGLRRLKHASAALVKLTLEVEKSK
jgi:hypothetical protein|tara:strand:- start:119 stop:313 length:195 start_codon:yes stop_codon:yes gene_type:complete